MAALFVLGALLFNFPLLAIFSRETLLWGVPLLYIYIFCACFVLIALMAWLVERG